MLNMINKPCIYFQRAYF